MTASRLATIVETSQDTIMSASLDGLVTAWNAAAERMFGYSAEEMIGRPVDLLTPAPERASIAAYLRQVRGGARVPPYDAVRLHRDGTPVHVQISLSPLLDGDGTVCGVSAIIRDVTEQRALRAMSEFLAEASERLARTLDLDATIAELAALAIERIADGCLITLRDREAEARGAYPYVNVGTASRHPATARLVDETEALYPLPVDAPSGYARAIRTGLAELVPDGAFEQDVLPRVAVNADHLERLRRLDMRSAMIVPLVARGETFGAVTLVRHGPGRRPAFTERDLGLAEELGRRAGVALDNARLHREVVEARSRAEEASRAKSEFLATMSHELRTPLHAIRGHVGLLELGLHGPITPAQQEALARVNRAQERLLGLINDVLNVARLESGEVHYDLQAIAVTDVVHEATSLLAPEIATRGIRLLVDGGDDAVVARADREKLGQILLNLLSNAMKFTPAGGAISVAWDATERMARLRVRDSGIGIPPDKLEVIFDPFVQLGRTTTGTASGTGLGLSISRQLARAMGGDLVAHSEAGTGAELVLELPLARPGGP